VLVVDDEVVAREGLARAVRSFGHRCSVATDGEAALKVMAESQVDVVISDWDMPGMSGPELCRRTRAAADDAPYTYFIILTGFDDREHLLAGMSAGADDYQHKPVNLDELEARLVSAARIVDLHRRLAINTAELRHDSRRFYRDSRVSVGVAEVDAACDLTPADWIARADAALYAAKSRGRNCVVSTPRDDA